MEEVERIKTRNRAYPVDTGYIICPSNMDRDTYVADCCKRQRVSILVDFGGTVVHDCYVSKGAFRDIEFPKTKESLGSYVVFVTGSFHSKPVVVAVIDKPGAAAPIEEQSFNKRVFIGENSVNISAKGRRGQLYIDVQSDSEDGGDIFLTLANRNANSRFSVQCKGEIELRASSNIVNISESEIRLRSVYADEDGEHNNCEIVASEGGFVVEDKFGNTLSTDEKGNINIAPKEKTVVSAGDQSSIRGDELYEQLQICKGRIDILQQCLQAVTSMTVESAYKAEVLALLATIIQTEDYGSIRSEKLFVE